MKKGKTLIFAILFIQLLLITSSINAVHIPLDNTQMGKSGSKTIEIVQQFSTPEIREHSEFITIHLKETNSFVMMNRKPILPAFLQTFEFPLGTRFKDIQCVCSDVEDLSFSKKIIPASKPVPWYQKEQKVQPEMEEDIYAANQLYPESWYSYKLTGGLNKNNEDTTFLTIQLNPVRYNPIKNTVQFVRSIKLDITYEESKENYVSLDEYDLLILSYDRYAPLLEPLVQHKKNFGVRTKLVTLQEVYEEEYFDLQGRDNPEKIKYFIKDAAMLILRQMLEVSMKS
jgi:hypothetical protein